MCVCVLTYCLPFMFLSKFRLFNPRWLLFFDDAWINDCIFSFLEGNVKKK